MVAKEPAVLSSLVIAILLIYGAVMLGMFLLQRRLMYYPETAIHPPAHYEMHQVEILTLTASDDTEIEVWLHPARSHGLPLIVYFHGNAGHVGDRAPKLRTFTDAGFGLLAVSYRGYGNSKGKPSEPGLYLDARRVVQHALEAMELCPENILLYGESLGSGVATHMAFELAAAGTPAGGLVLEAPYTSVARRAQEMYPFIPAFYLARDKYHSIDKISQINCPLLLFHGELDTVIPIHHGRKLIEAAKEPKHGVYFDTVDHTQFDYAELTRQMIRFAKQHNVSAPPSI